MSWNHKDEFEIKFKEDVIIREGFNRIYKFNKGDILTGLADGYCGGYDDKNGYISIITYEDRKKLETINVYYKYMEYIIDKISNEHVYFNEDGTVKETNYKRKYDYFIAGMSCYDDEYPTHR